MESPYAESAEDDPFYQPSSRAPANDFTTELNIYRDLQDASPSTPSHCGGVALQSSFENLRGLEIVEWSDSTTEDVADEADAHRPDVDDEETPRRPRPGTLTQEGDTPETSSTEWDQINASSSENNGHTEGSQPEETVLTQRLAHPLPAAQTFVPGRGHAPPSHHSHPPNAYYRHSRRMSRGSGHMSRGYFLPPYGHPPPHYPPWGYNQYYPPYPQGFPHPNMTQHMPPPAYPSYPGPHMGQYSGMQPSGPYPAYPEYPPRASVASDSSSMISGRASLNPAATGFVSSEYSASHRVSDTSSGVGVSGSISQAHAPSTSGSGSDLNATEASGASMKQLTRLAPSEISVAPKVATHPFNNGSGQGVIPSFTDVAANLPFVEASSLQGPHMFAVVKFTNIVYFITKAEIVHYFKQFPRIKEYPRSSGNYGIHLITDRIEGKSMDAYVEFETRKDAEDAVAWNESLQPDRRRKLGPRVPNLRLSNQAELMHALFPRAYGVKWNGHTPVIEDPENLEGPRFTGIMNDEELYTLASFAENPRRSMFRPKIATRPWETMMSILQKFPWSATSCYTMHQRYKIFVTLVKCVEGFNVKAHQQTIGPLFLVLRGSLLVAAVNCPGFTEFERATLGNLYGVAPYGWRRYFPLAGSWPFFALHLKPGVDMHVLEKTVTLLRQSETDPAIVRMQYIQHHKASSTSPWGFVVEDLWPTDEDEEPGSPGLAGSLTMAQVAEIEFSVVQEQLWLVLGVLDGKVAAPANGPGIGSKSGMERVSQGRKR